MMQEKPEEQAEQGQGCEREYVVRFHLPKPPKLLPKEARQHLRAARKEVLLAFRSLIDTAIEKMDETRPESKGPTKIDLE